MKKEFSTYFVLMTLIAVSLPFSKFTLTVFELLLLLYWACHEVSLSAQRAVYRNENFVKATQISARNISKQIAATLKNKFRLFLSNRLALVLSSLFLLHIIGLISTTDFAYAWKDLRTKLPLLVLPLIMSSMPRFSRRQNQMLLGIFVLAVFAGILISSLIYLKKDFSNIRDISPYISPVRFALMVVFSFFLIVLYLFSTKQINWIYRLALSIVALYFVLFLIIIESAIGLVSLFVITLVLLLHLMLRHKSLLFRTALTVVFVAFGLGTIWYIADVAKNLTIHKPVDIGSLDKYSKLGNAYRHDTIHFGVEGGRYVGLYFAEDELAQAWNSRSRYDFYGNDDAGQLIMYTIIRYLTSADLRKDAEGVAKLTAEDIRHIEKGIANKNYIEKPGLSNRISKMLTGYQQSVYMNDPSGSSTMQRVEHLRVSLILIKRHFWWGVGTGDIPEVFKQIYEEVNTRLKPDVRWRSHNQYLSMHIGFGFFGLLWFLYTLIFPLFYQKAFRDTRFFVFWLLMILSMFTEDTLETQTGVTLFAFFFSYFGFTAFGFYGQTAET